MAATCQPEAGGSGLGCTSIWLHGLRDELGSGAESLQHMWGLLWGNARGASSSPLCLCSQHMTQSAAMTCS